MLFPMQQALLAFFVGVALAVNNVPCPVLGPAFPKPSLLAENKAFGSSLQALDRALDQAIKNGTQAMNITTFSIGIFSTYQEGTIHQYHHTTPGVANGTVGTRHAQGDSIYRIASCSKLLTMFMFLIKEGFARFEDPISKYIPELAPGVAPTTSPYGILPNWDEITIGDLSCHTGGIERDVAANNLFRLRGAPPRPKDLNFTCDTGGEGVPYHGCNNSQYMTEFRQLPAIFAAAQTPSYANPSYQLIGYALAQITGKSVEDIMSETLIDPLKLNGTSYDVPSDSSRGVIPIGVVQSGWSDHLEGTSYDGGYFTSTDDFATLGRAIMNSTFLPQVVTRRWFKPRTFTADARGNAVGAPWEIFRHHTPGRTIDFYTKGGDYGFYGSLITLVPDYNFGFSILTASVNEGTAVYKLSNLIGSIIMPALEQAAKDEAEANFAGEWTDSKSNSSITIAVNEWPALRVTRFVVNGVNELPRVIGGDDGSARTEWRLQPNELYQDGKHVGFTGIVAPTISTDTPLGYFDTPCASWYDPGGSTVYSLDATALTFEVDANGKAISMTSPAFEVTLGRT